MKKYVLVLATCLAMSGTPHLQADFNPLWTIPIYSAYCLFSCFNKESKVNPEFKGSGKKLRSLAIADPNWWQNIWNLHDEWMVGQRGKERLLKTNKDGHIKVSSKKCSAHGFTGKMLEHLDTVNKTRKAMVDVAFMYCVILALKAGPHGNIIERVLNWPKDNPITI